MRTWIVLGNYQLEWQPELQGRLGDNAQLEKVAVFTSGDGDEPMRGDLEEALEGFQFEGDQELLLVPLDAGHSITVRTKTTIDVLSTGSVPA